MAHYASDTDLYSDLGECLREVLSDPENAGRATSVGSVIRIETVRPKARLTLNLADDSGPEVLFGDCDLRPAAVITMEADAARGFFLGELSLIGALSGGKMTAQGPVAPILRVVPLANLVAPALRERVEGGGGEPATEGSEAEEPASEQAVAEEPEAEEPASEETVAEETAAEDSASEETAAEEPAAEEPAAEEPDGDQS